MSALIVPLIVTLLKEPLKIPFKGTQAPWLSWELYFDPKVPIIYGTWALRENLKTPKDSTGPISATMPHSKNEPELIEFIGRPDTFWVVLQCRVPFNKGYRVFV